MMKKAISILISSLMIFSYISFTAHAASDTSFDDINVNQELNMEELTDPTCDYKFIEQADINYTFRRQFYLDSNITYSFYTSKASEYADCDTELFLFKESMEPGIYSWYNDDDQNHYSRITITPPVSGVYVLMAKIYTPQFHAGACPTGYCDVYEQMNSGSPICVNSAAKLGGFEVTVSNSFPQSSRCLYNSFTANSSSNTVDPVMFVIDKYGAISDRKIVGYNDDFEYDPSHSLFNWLRQSRVEQHYSTNKKTIFISSYSMNTEGNADIYAFCYDKYDHPNIHSIFPNYHMTDRINSAQATDDYNCIAYSGGITNTWINPQMTYLGNQLSPWYNTNNIVALDNYYGNNPLRYSGAMTYEETQNENDALVNVYKKGNTWVHAAVTKNANYQNHGYSWESKIGDGERVFHALHSLDEDNDHTGLYGTIERMYKSVNPNYTSGMTMEESINLGLTIFQDINFTNNELSIIRQKLDSISSETYNNFLMLYSNWVTKVQEDEELSIINDYTYYFNNEEYRLLSSFIDDNENILYLICDLYIKEGYDVYKEALIGNKLVIRNETTMLLAEKIRNLNNKISMDSADSEAYIAPSIDTNIKCFIKEIIKDESILF